VPIRRTFKSLISRAAPLRGNFFRSVAFRYIHPDDVVSGQGTRLHGGRFVPRGVPAVYASLEEETALREAASRQRLISGRSHIKLRDYYLRVVSFGAVPVLTWLVYQFPDFGSVIYKLLQPGVPVIK